MKRLHFSTILALLSLPSISMFSECQKVLVKDKSGKRSHYTTVCGVVRSADGVTILGGVPPKVPPASTSSVANSSPPTTLATMPPAVLPASMLPNEAGVYLIDGDRLQELDPEVVGWQTGGVLKSMATLGLDKGHVNGKIMRPTSRLRLTLPAVFIICTLEGTSASEYQLLELYEKGNRREFRAVTGGVVHASAGEERTTIDFQSEKIAPRTWRVKLEKLTPGEYGFLPPGMNAAGISSSGKIYSFGVIE